MTNRTKEKLNENTALLCSYLNIPFDQTSPEIDPRAQAIYNALLWTADDAEAQRQLAEEPKRVIKGCQHDLARMIVWAQNGACPICLTADRGMAFDLLRESAEGLELALGRLGCSVAANDGGGHGKHDADSFGGLGTLHRIRDLLGYTR